MRYISKELSELLENINYHIITQDCTDQINDVRCDSRTVTKGSMYVAINGEKYDGHNFIEEAYRNGAKYIIINNEMINIISYMTYRGTSIIAVEDTRVSLPYIINNLYSHPSHNFQLVGVTGTNGKTSVTTITKYVLMKMHHKVGLIGTINNYIDNEILDINTTTSTTPDCVELGVIMNEFSVNKVDVTLMEASSMALKMHEIPSLHFQGIFLR